jgi:hypothetical protein
MAQGLMAKLLLAKFLMAKLVEVVVVSFQCGAMVYQLLPSAWLHFPLLSKLLEY